MSYTLGIDLGTSYFKFGIFDCESNLLGLASMAVEKQTQDEGQCELPCEKFVEILQTGIEQACQEAGIVAAEIQFVGYSSQANSFALFDDDNEPLTPLILWPDVQAKKVYPEVKELWGREDFLAKTGMGIEAAAGLCVNKIIWLRERYPNMWKYVRGIMTISDYLVYLLTQKRVSDIGTASLLGLMDCETGEWVDEYFEILGLDKKMFSERLAVGTLAGQTTAITNKTLGLEIGTNVYIGSLDHHMATLGAGLDEID